MAVLTMDVLTTAVLVLTTAAWYDCSHYGPMPAVTILTTAVLVLCTTYCCTSKYCLFDIAEGLAQAHVHDEFLRWDPGRARRQQQPRHGGEGGLILGA